MTPDELAARHPVLYHMAEPGSWSSIRRHGLLSATALLDLFGVGRQERAALGGGRRPSKVVLRHPALGAAVLRDQKPLSDAALRSCLVDMEPHEWYALLNRKVFFYPTRARLTRLLEARSYRAGEHTVLTLDTAALLARHVARTTLASINTGSTVRRAVARGFDTFQPLASYPADDWRRRRLAEVAVERSVPDVVDLVRRVERWQGPHLLHTTELL